MKKILLCFAIILLLAPVVSFAQSRPLLIAADRSFSDAESNYKKREYREAAANFEIVVNSIPVEIESRKYLMMRLDALTALVDIYYNHRTNLELACARMETFASDMNYVKRADVLRGKQLYNYVQLEKDFEKYSKNCRTFKNIESDKDKFERIFDEEFNKN